MFDSQTSWPDEVDDNKEDRANDENTNAPTTSGSVWNRDTNNEDVLHGQQPKPDTHAQDEDRLESKTKQLTKHDKDGSLQTISPAIPS